MVIFFGRDYNNNDFQAQGKSGFVFFGSS